MVKGAMSSPWIDLTRWEAAVEIGIFIGITSKHRCFFNYILFISHFFTVTSNIEVLVVISHLSALPTFFFKKKIQFFVKQNFILFYDIYDGLWTV